MFSPLGKRFRLLIRGRRGGEILKLMLVGIRRLKHDAQLFGQFSQKLVEFGVAVAPQRVDALHGPDELVRACARRKKRQ